MHAAGVRWFGPEPYRPATAAAERLPARAATPTAPPAAPPAPPARPTDGPAATDCELLLGAVAQRLQASADDEKLAPTLLRQAVQESAQALAQLREGLAQLEAARASLAHELRQARAALAASRVELAGTRDGERRARHRADHDALTLLPNRQRFQTRLDEALGAAQPPALAVLFIDLDDFKPVNDRHGHAVGDQLLRVVAQRLSRVVRAGDMVCRLGGDEFACLLANPVGRKQLGQLARKLFDAVSAPLQLGSLQVTVRPSIGIAMSPGDGSASDELLQRADGAMYRAKRLQLGHAFFDRGADV